MELDTIQGSTDQSGDADRDEADRSGDADQHEADQSGDADQNESDRGKSDRDEADRSGDANQDEADSGKADRSYSDLCAAARAEWEAKQWEKSIAHCQYAIVLEPETATAYTLLGNVFSAQARPETALRAYAKAMSFDPYCLESLVNAGSLCIDLGHSDRAIECYQQALRLRTGPNDTGSNSDLISVYHNLGKLECDRGNRDLGIQLYRQALALDPQSRLTRLTYIFLGEALAHVERYDESIATFEAFLGLAPESRPDILHKLAFAYQHGGYVDQGIALGRELIAQDPTNQQGRLNLAYALLKVQPEPEGWDMAEARFSIEPFSFFARRCEPAWQGEPIEGKTILLHQEQGLGDTIQFCRYVPLVAARGARVVFQCNTTLVRLLSSLPDIAAFVAWEDEAFCDFDVALPLLSLPRIFGTTLATIPATVPYLAAPAAVRSEPGMTLERDPDRLNIGLVWASGYKGDHIDLLRDYELRSIALAPLLAACDRPEVKLWSLQVGKDAAQIAALGAGDRITDLSNRLQDMAHTAALIDQLDLVISVDTAVAHLAGALAKPVWILLRSSCDWRWLSDRSDSPWYPTARLFRQPKPGDWASVFQAIETALDERLALG